MSALLHQIPGPVDTSHSPFARLHTLPFESVTLASGLLADWQKTNLHASLEHGFRMLEQAGNLHNFRVAAGRETGEYRGRNFLDSDVYKWLEAVAYGLRSEPNAALQAMADQAIELIMAAQQPDGYLNTYYQIAEPHKRWADLDHGHELYCAGHLFQAAVVFHRLLGDDRLLTVATRFADHIASIFGPDRRHGACGHPEVEMSLVELYRVTGEQRYLELARFFIDQRGQGRMRGLGWYGPEYHQDRVPVRQATEIEGHAVRAMYLMAGVSDLYLETGEKALLDALERLWQDMTRHKLHLTGGVGARYEGESFGDPYELPNDQCYCETCAAIGSMMWNWRMLLATGEGRFADVLEQTLYNGFLSGIALDGTHFFYINPLLSRGKYQRAEWYEVACCPPNVMRTIGALGHYLATSTAEGIQLHLYSAAALTVERRAGQSVRLRLETDYPWTGTVRVVVEASDGADWTLALRIPAWSRGATVAINGAAVAAPVSQGYAQVRRAWRAGDVVELDLQMVPRFVEAHPKVEPTRCSLAIQRGPVVYCLEQTDQEAGVDILAVQVDERAPLESQWEPGLLGGVVTVMAAGYALDLTPWEGHLYRSLGDRDTLPRRPVRLKAIPYYAWGNRGPTAMRVWIPRAGSA